MSLASPDPPQDAGIAEVEGATLITVRRRLPPFHFPGWSGAGVLFLGYVLFEMPSNLILARMGARVCIARIMITWGLVAAGAWVPARSIR